MKLKEKLSDMNLPHGHDVSFEIAFEMGFQKGLDMAAELFEQSFRSDKYLGRSLKEAKVLIATDIRTLGEQECE